MTSSETSTESSKHVSVFCPLCCGIFHDWRVLEKAMVVKRISNIWQTVRRITIEILGVKG